MNEQNETVVARELGDDELAGVAGGDHTDDEKARKDLAMGLPLEHVVLDSMPSPSIHS
jgi:hypothetical protein